MKDAKAYVKEIGKAVGRLLPAQGKIARRNALGEVSKKIRALKRRIREQFPPIRSGERKRSSCQSLRARGYIEADWPRAERVKLLGGRVFKVRTCHKNFSGEDVKINRWFIPAWAVNAPDNLIKRLQSDVRFRKKWEVEQALSAQEFKQGKGVIKKLLAGRQD